MKLIGFDLHQKVHFVKKTCGIGANEGVDSYQTVKVHTIQDFKKGGKVRPAQKG